LRRDEEKWLRRFLVKLKIAAIEEFEIFLYSPKEKIFLP
jgi:hypothetical protein